MDTRERILENTQQLVLERGFAGTSIDDILKITGLSKGAFFYHFKSKADLGEALVRRYAEQDLSIFSQLGKRADELSDDPLQSTLIFLKLFEEFIEQQEDSHQLCLFAAYVYEQENFSETIAELVTEGFKAWREIYSRRFAVLLADRTPVIPVTADELAELIMSIIQGSFILGKSLLDKDLLIRNSSHFRNYLKTIFSE